MSERQLKGDAAAERYANHVRLLYAESLEKLTAKLTLHLIDGAGGGAGQGNAAAGPTIVSAGPAPHLGHHVAKYLASEFCSEVTQQSFRIHGGYGYSKEYEIERLMRDAPFLLIGEGTSEIQKSIISKRLLAEYRI